MSLFLFKSILATFFLLAGLIAVISMLTLMGRQGRKISANFLRKAHKISGFIFCVLLIVISYFCIKYWVTAGDQISARAIAHSVLALALFIIFILKILIVQFYKQFLKYVPVLGMIVFALSFIVFSTSAGFFFLRTFCEKGETVEAAVTPRTDLQGNVEKGALLYNNKCGACHYANKEDKKLGPGLKNILRKERLPHSGRPANIENIKSQLIKPVLTMPSFSNLTEQELADLLAYLETL
ncbi:MAG: cytochrome c [Candidatus Aminicenantes bacterium]|nr:MAG: cytochrome c [Candidatus Aminicenantes bacterium]